MRSATLPPARATDYATLVKSSPTSSPPAANRDRIASLDVVRGVAVLGILAANIIAFGQPMTAYTWPGAFLVPPGPLGDWLWGVQFVLVDGKFRGMFTLLFGAGMVLFYRRALAKECSNRSARGLLARRLAWLGLFGFLHWALLWRGDILLSYALAGLAVLWFVEWDWTKQLTLGLIAYAAGALDSYAASVPAAAAAQGRFAAGSHMASLRAELLEAEAEHLADGKAESTLIAAGDYGGMVAHTLREHLASLPGGIATVLLEAGPLMLIGMGLLGAGLFNGGIAPRRQRRWGWALWLLGTLATIPIAWRTMARGITYWDSFAASTGWSVLPHLFASVGLIALLALWGRTAHSAFAIRLAAAGRCAFTNYIGTSALALAIFSGSGLGLFGKLGRLELYGVMLVFWLIMLAWPKWWLTRFRHGPLEWLWRCLTYWRALPLRR